MGDCAEIWIFILNFKSNLFASFPVYLLKKASHSHKLIVLGRRSFRAGGCAFPVFLSVCFAFVFYFCALFCSFWSLTFLTGTCCLYLRSSSSLSLFIIYTSHLTLLFFFLVCFSWSFRCASVFWKIILQHVTPYELIFACVCWIIQYFKRKKTSCFQIDSVQKCFQIEEQSPHYAHFHLCLFFQLPFVSFCHIYWPSSLTSLMLLLKQGYTFLSNI